MVKIRHRQNGGDMDGRNLLQPDRLPDAALRGIEHAAPFQLLLASALPGGIASILHPDEQFEGKGTGVRLFRAGSRQNGRDVQTEGQIAAGMHACLLPVDIDDAVLIHRAEMQKEPPAFCGPAHGHLAPVPQIFLWMKLTINAGKRAFRGEGDQDSAVESFRSLRPPGKRVIPQPVQIDPALPRHGGAGIFLPDVLRSDGGGPGGGKLFGRTGMFR